MNRPPARFALYIYSVSYMENHLAPVTVRLGNHPLHLPLWHGLAPVQKLVIKTHLPVRSMHCVILPGGVSIYTWWPIQRLVALTPIHG